MRRLQMLAFAVPLSAILACHDATAPRDAASRNIRAQQQALRTGGFTTFDVPGAGAGQPFFPSGINASGAITGYDVDANGVAHGFVRAPDGNITAIDVPGAGTGQGQGTTAISINSRGAITGTYVDANGVRHGFLFEP